ncbi:MAG: cupin domain-containing protein [Chloroflexi bacterium]|nr:cupin domain-containing protein [Chloroflexota bacterium]
MISKANAEHYTWGNNCDGWRLVNRMDLSVIHECMPPGTSEVRHYHQTARQFFFVLSGVATLEIDGQRELLHAQQGVEVAPSVPHQMMNESENATEFIVISHPTTQGDRVNA